MFKSIFWDIDGTLLDTEKIYRECLIKVCKKIDCDLDITITSGVSQYDLWDMLSHNHHYPNREEWLQLICMEYQAKAHSIKIRKGIIETLHYMKDYGLKQAIVSNAVRDIVTINLTQTSLLPFFEHILTRNDIIKPKPDPEPYLLSIKHFGIKSCEGIAVEDTPLGIMSAKNAGLTAIAFPNQYTKNMDFRLADFIIQHPRELIKIVIEKTHMGMASSTS